MITFSVARPLRYAAIRHSVPAELIKGWAAAKVRPARSQLIGLIVVVLLLPGVARADAIDGHWCHDDGRRFEIIGPMIVTPARSQTQGRYDRHYFSYVVPNTDPGAGSTVDMVLMGETALRLKAGNTAEEIWNRCGPPISLRGWPVFG